MNEVLKVFSDIAVGQKVNKKKTTIRNLMAVALTKMCLKQEMIYFKNDRSDLSDLAMATLNDKIILFQTNPEKPIVIFGAVCLPRTSKHNSALELKRAEVTKAYLILHGIDSTRIEITTRGERILGVENRGIGNVENQSGQFQLLIVNPYMYRQ